MDERKPSIEEFEEFRRRVNEAIAKYAPGARPTFDLVWMDAYLGQGKGFRREPFYQAVIELGLSIFVEIAHQPGDPWTVEDIDEYGHDCERTFDAFFIDTIRFGALKLLKAGACGRLLGLESEWSNQTGNLRVGGKQFVIDPGEDKFG